MKNLLLFSFLILNLIIFVQCDSSKKTEKISDEFPDEMVNFVSFKNNPVFTGTNDNTWDANIRERGYILKEDSIYHLWYTGFKTQESEMHLGYATSKDGISWIRNSKNPIYSKGWVEDMSVIKVDSVYYMFAEGKGDIAHMLSSIDRVNWTEKGNLIILKTNGEPISSGSYGTPAIFYENSTYYLFYERGDLGIWLASSKDLKVWKNVQDEPVINMGPEPYDKYAVAMNQIIKYKGKYYGYYHGTAFKDWSKWTTNVAVSDDLIHWEKYQMNPILGDNKSSGILVNDGKRYRLYTMHDNVNLHFPKNDSLP